MVGRYTGACLGLFAFAIAIVAGLSVDNPPMLVLSRAIRALVVFCAIGLFLGAVAQAVVNEHHRRREQVVLGSGHAETASASGVGDAPATAAEEQSEHAEVTR